MTAGQQTGQEIRQQTEMIRRDLGGVGVAPRDRIPAIQPLADGENRARGGDVRPSGQGLCAKDRAQYFQLWQIEPGIAREQA